MSRQFLALFFDVLIWILEAIWWIVLLWVLLSWVLFFLSQSSFRWRNRGAFNILTHLNDIFTRMARPFVRPFQRLLPPWKTGGIDWSPILLALAIYILERVIRIIYVGILGR